MVTPCMVSPRSQVPLAGKNSNKEMAFNALGQLRCMFFHRAPWFSERMVPRMVNTEPQKCHTAISITSQVKIFVASIIFVCHFGHEVLVPRSELLQRKT